MCRSSQPLRKWPLIKVAQTLSWLILLMGHCTDSRLKLSNVVLVYDSTSRSDQKQMGTIGYLHRDLLYLLIIWSNDCPPPEGGLWLPGTTIIWNNWWIGITNGQTPGPFLKKGSPSGLGFNWRSETRDYISIRSDRCMDNKRWSTGLYLHPFCHLGL